MVLSLCHLVEAEGRVLRESVRQTSFSCALAVVGVIFLAVGLILLMAAAYHLLSALMPVGWVYVILGAVCMALAGVFLWRARHAFPTAKSETRCDGEATHAAR